MDKEGLPFPDTANIVAGSLGVVVRVAVRQIRVVSIRSRILRRRPKVVSGNIFCCRLLKRNPSSLASKVEEYEIIPFILRARRQPSREVNSSRQARTIFLGGSRNGINAFPIIRKIQK